MGACLETLMAEEICKMRSCELVSLTHTQGRHQWAARTRCVNALQHIEYKRGFSASRRNFAVEDTPFNRDEASIEFQSFLRTPPPSPQRERSPPWPAAQSERRPHEPPISDRGWRTGTGNEQWSGVWGMDCRWVIVRSFNHWCLSVSKQLYVYYTL